MSAADTMLDWSKQTFRGLLFDKLRNCLGQTDIRYPLAPSFTVPACPGSLPVSADTMPSPSSPFIAWPP